MARKSRNVKKLTPGLLRKLVLSEKRKLAETLEKGEEAVDKVKAEEIPADGYADSIEKDIDFIKALNIQEKKLIKKIKKIREVRETTKRRIRRLK